MDKVLAVARREFLATVRTRAFLFSVVLMPGIIVAAIYGTELMQRRSREEKLPTRYLAVVDETGLVFPGFAARIAAHNRERPLQPFELEQALPAELDDLRQRVRRGALYAYIWIKPEAVAGTAGCVLARATSQLQVGEFLERALRETIRLARFQEAGIDVARIQALTDQPIPIEQLDVQSGQPVRSNKLARLMTPFAFMFLLFMGTFGISQGLLTTLIEEKGSRVIEVLLSAVSPVQLMAGKILGLVLVGLLLLVVWGAAGSFGARSYQADDLITLYRVGAALLYFLPGFLLMASLLAAIGSVCNELRDAQSMVFPLSLMTIVPMIFWFYIAENPGSALSIALSFIPPITPFIMILRICSDPDTPLWQIVSTLTLLWASVALTVWAAGKVFRTGVLMYGKPPSVREMLRWVRHA